MNHWRSTRTLLWSIVQWISRHNLLAKNHLMGNRVCNIFEIAAGKNCTPSASKSKFEMRPVGCGTGHRNIERAWRFSTFCGQVDWVGSLFSDSETLSEERKKEKRRTSFRTSHTRFSTSCCVRFTSVSSYCCVNTADGRGSLDSNRMGV